MRRIFALLIIFLMLAVPVSAAIKACLACNSTCNTLPGEQGIPGPEGSMNQTPNQTPGEPGSEGPPGTTSHNLLENLTAYDDHTQYAYLPGRAAVQRLQNIFSVSDGDAVNWSYVRLQINSSPSAGGIDFDSHIGTNRSAIEGEIATNASADRQFTDAHIGTNRTAIEGEIQTNASATLTTADQHIGSNRTSIESEISTNASADRIFTDQHIGTNRSAIEGEIGTNRSSLESEIATNLSVVWNNLTAVNTSMRNNVSANFVPMVGNKTPTINLGSGTADATTYLRGDLTWATPPGGSAPDLTPFPFLNGTRQFTGTVNLSGGNISGIKTIIGNNDAVNLSLSQSMNTSLMNNVSQYVILVNNSMRNNVSQYFTPMVSNKTPPINLGSGTADSTTYLRGDQTWASPAGGSDPTSKSTTLIHSDFYDPGVDNALPGLAGLAISSGTAAVVATTVDHPGVVYMRDSTTANGGYKYGCVGTQLIGGGETFEVAFQPVGIRAGQTAKMGWSDTAAAATLPVDGVFFNISSNGAAITLRGNTSSNSVRSGTATTYAPTTATWYRGTIAVNAAGTLVTYTLYSAAGASLWTDTVATNIPTGAGRDTSPCIIVAESSTDAAADIVRLDYVKWGTTRTLTR